METYLIGFPGNYLTPSLVGTQYTLFNLISAGSDGTPIYWTGSFGGDSYVEITNQNGTTRKNISRGGVVIDNEPFSITYGQNTITYYLYGMPEDNPYSTIEITYVITIYGVTNRYPLKPWTVEEVIDRALQLAEPLRYGEEPSFRLRKDLGGVLNEQFTAFSPEFTFTRMNLREVMQTIGGVLHAAPRLQLYDPINAAAMGLPLYSGEWFFEKFGNEKLATYKDRKDGQEKPYNAYQYTTRKCSHEIEQACTKLDSYMDNLVNRINWQNGTITNPSSNVNYGVTLRAENLYLRLNEDSTGTYLLTDFPIDKLVKLEVIQRDTDGNLITPTKDITPYVFPKSVYDNLSSYGGGYPTSKSYALYFTQGEKDIKGFFFKAPSEFGGTVGEDYTIKNVLKTVGISAKNNDDYMRAEFRITYVPIYSTRIQHSKAYLGDHLSAPRTLNYAQSDNSVETRFFGENIKGAAQRLGTVEKYVTFNIKRLKNVPKAGDLWDDEYYISTVQISALRDRFEITCGLSQNFNRKSKYIGADSHKRIYEVSETMVQERHRVLTDNVIFSTREKGLSQSEYESSNFGNLYMSDYCFQYYVKSIISPSSYSNKKLQTARLKGYNINLSPLHNYYVDLPCICGAFGNSIEFTFECADNFSAGTQVEKVDSGSITGFFTKGTEYADYYGRMYFMQWHLTPDDEESEEPAESALSYPKDTRAFRVIKHLAGTGNGTAMLDWYRKDSREKTKMSYRIEAFSEDKNLIIGSGLGLYNLLVTNERQGVGDTVISPKVIVLNKKIGKFDDLFDDSARIASYDLNSVGASGTYINYQGVTSQVKGQAWVIAYPYYYKPSITIEDEAGNVTQYEERCGGEILIGRNIDVSVGNTVGDFVAYAVHDLQAYITARRKAGKLKL